VVAAGGGEQPAVGAEGERFHHVGVDGRPVPPAARANLVAQRHTMPLMGV